MGNKEVFVSYAHEDLEKVKEIVDCLEGQGVYCWYAPRDVGARRYAKAICDAIESARIFLLMLSKHSAVSEHVLNEVEMAYNKRRASNGNLVIQTLCLEQLDTDSPEFDEIMYYIRRINFIQADSFVSPLNLAEQFIDANKSILHISKINKPKPDATSEYYSSRREDNRLEIQNRLVRAFDIDVYRKYLSGYECPVVLDVGCGNGAQIMDRLASVCRDYRLAGIDRDGQKIAEATERFSREGRAKFLRLDISDEEFEDKLAEFSRECGYEKYDVINISMLLLHIKSKCALLRVLRRMLKDDGVVIIKDIDDGLNFAFPDEEGVFDRIYRICDNNETSGLRKNGRRIYTNLYRAGYRNIILEKEGMTSIGMNYDEKEDFFNMYFRMILGDVRWMHEKYPDNRDIEEEYNWYKENYERISEMFMCEDFVFSLGFQIYVAKK